MSTRKQLASYSVFLVAFCVLGLLYIGNHIYSSNPTRKYADDSSQSQNLRKFDSVMITKMMSGNDSKAVINEKDSCHPDYFKNALMRGRHRNRKGFLTIGIPSMTRPENQTYLWQTLDSLLNNSNVQEQNETVIVILLSDLEQEKRNTKADSIAAKYPQHIASGLIQVIQVPLEFYPSFDNLKRTYHHPMAKVKWRSKQNIDYGFMMKYSRNISDYYLQLEDDVYTVPRYMDKMKAFMKSHKVWTCLEFSILGYIAKLYHSYDLNQLADMLILFYKEQPNDVTYMHFNSLQTQWKRIILKPTIFQHQGYHSTYVHKKVPRKDEWFRDPQEPKNKQSQTPATSKRDPTKPSKPK